MATIIGIEDLEITLEAGSSLVEINAALQSHRRVLLKPGIYSLGAGPITLPADKVLEGFSEAGFGGVTLSFTATTGAGIEMAIRSSLKNVIVNGPGQGVGTAIGVQHTDTSDSVYLERVVAQSWGASGIEIEKGEFAYCTSNSNGDKGFQIGTGVSIKPGYVIHCQASFNTNSGFQFVGEPLEDLHIRDCIANSNGGQGFLFQSPTGSQAIRRIFLRRCTARSNTGDGIRMFTPGLILDVHISQCDMSFNDRGIDVAATGNISRIHIHDINASANTGLSPDAGIRIAGAVLTGGVITNCVARGNAGDGIVMNPTTIDQGRITGCLVIFSGAVGIFAGGALLGASASSAGHVVGNLSRGNTGANFSVGASYVGADNV